jgi:hypothetical protein
MTRRRPARPAILGLVLLGMTGCDTGIPPSGSRAVVPADLLEQQRVKVAEMKTKMKMKTQPVSKPVKHR